MTTYYGPDQWGPPSWRYLRTVIETASDEQAQTGLLPMIKTFAAMLPCESCRKNFDDVLRRFPPEHYVKRDRASRLVWYDLVRAEVRSHEPPKTLARWLARHRVEILKAVGFIVFLVIAGVIGALVLRRCQEKGLVAVKTS